MGKNTSKQIADPFKQLSGNLFNSLNNVIKLPGTLATSAGSFVSSPFTPILIIGGVVVVGIFVLPKLAEKL